MPHQINFTERAARDAYGQPTGAVTTRTVYADAAQITTPFEQRADGNVATPELHLFVRDARGDDLPARDAICEFKNDTYRVISGETFFQFPSGKQSAVIKCRLQRTN